MDAKAREAIMSPDKKEMVMRMLEKGMPPADVAEMAQVSEEEVQAILAPEDAKSDEDDNDEDEKDDMEENQKEAGAEMPDAQAQSEAPGPVVLATSNQVTAQDGSSSKPTEQTQQALDAAGGATGQAAAETTALPPAHEWEKMTPAERRAARKAAAPPSQDLTLQLRDIMSGLHAGLTRAQMADEVLRVVEARGDVNVTDVDDGGGGNTVLMFAVQNASNADVIKRLLNAKANPQAKNSAGFTTLHTCASRKMPDAAVPEIVSLLIAHKCDPSAAAGPQELTPLHVAAQWQNLDMCRLLMDAGADANAQTCTGATPFEWGKRRMSPLDTFTLHAILSR